MTTRPAGPAEEQLRAWRASGKRYQAIAAAIAEWAATQEPGSALPGDDHFAGDLDFTPPLPAGQSPQGHAPRPCNRAAPAPEGFPRPSSPGHGTPPRQPPSA